LTLVAESFQLTEGTNLFTGPAAIRQTIRRLDADGSLARARLLLFSTHGELNLANAALSALVLGRPSQADESERYFTARDISSLTLGADLVVVSSCDSGQGRFAAGEGLLGLPYSLFAAGATAAVLTRWGIYDDPVTADFVRDLFVAVRDNREAADALAALKRILKRTKPEAYWAAFVLIGR
jgi:CHAT domain-containing protein